MCIILGKIIQSSCNFLWANLRVNHQCKLFSCFRFSSVFCILGLILFIELVCLTSPMITSSSSAHIFSVMKGRKVQQTLTFHEKIVSNTVWKFPVKKIYFIKVCLFLVMKVCINFGHFTIVVIVVYPFLSQSTFWKMLICVCSICIFNSLCVSKKSRCHTGLWCGKIYFSEDHLDVYPTSCHVSPAGSVAPSPTPLVGKMTVLPYSLAFQLISVTCLEQVNNWCKTVLKTSI